MPWKGIFVVAFGLLTSGCVLSAYQLASWTVTGVSYAFSGKGLGDHALSFAISKDCATLRILQDKEICIDYGSDFENSWTALASTWSVPELLSEPATVATVDVAETSVVLSGFSSDTTKFLAPASDTLTVQAAAMTVQLDMISRDQEVARSGLDFTGLVESVQQIEPAPEAASWLAFTATPRSLEFSGLAPGGVAFEIVSIKEFKAPVKQVSVRVLNKAAIYLVLGSFRNDDNAQALRIRHADRNTHVITLQADNRAMFRVLAGPIDAGVLTKTRVDFAKAGIRNSWAVRLCSASLAPLPCEPVLQQASLPR